MLHYLPTLLQWLVPKAARKLWIAEWQDELRHGRRTNWRRTATNIWRDALFTRKQNPQPQKRWLPLVPELTLFVVATSFWFLATPQTVPEVCGTNLHRVVFVQRTYAAMAASVSVVTSRLQQMLREAPEFESVASFRVNPGDTNSVAVSRDMLSVLGVTPILGKPFDASTPLNTAILSHSSWDKMFHRDPTIIGKRVWLNGRLYPVVAVLPEEFYFLSKRVGYLEPLAEGTRVSGAVALLKEGTSIANAQETLRSIAVQANEGWTRESYSLRPYFALPRWRDVAMPALGIALLCTIGGGLLLFWKTKGGRLYYFALAARFVLVVLSLAQLSDLAGRWATANLFPFAGVFLWLYVTTSFVQFFLMTRDHLQRCPRCLQSLRLPTSYGTWSSLVVDAPATEYACPNGHGLLYREEVGERNSRWTSLDESWRSLFSRKQ